MKKETKKPKITKQTWKLAIAFDRPFKKRFAYPKVLEAIKAPQPKCKKGKDGRFPLDEASFKVGWNKALDRALKYYSEMFP